MSQRKYTNLRSIYLKIIIILIIISYHYIGHMYMFYTDKQFEGKITSSKINVTKKKYMVIKIDDISKKVKRDNQYKRMSIVLAVIYTLMIIKYLI